MTILAAICAIDARYGIIPDSLVAALAAGGLLQTSLIGQAGLMERGFEVAAVFAAAALFRASYRWIRGFDGLWLGDVKFLAAAPLWTGLAGIPVLLLITVLSAIISLVIIRVEGHELDGEQAIAFGPHLAVALWLTWAAGPMQCLSHGLLMRKLASFWQKLSGANDNLKLVTQGVWVQKLCVL